ncbi:hypothetical protein [Vibrio breoganii]|uniref:hypothetical protein n=1 Tax=Vibrio breoganii TaxID=553239 RepID=UPI000C84E35B|nr:hypothetical protein [Vibrio breoganii]PMG07208.1 hypothetical protein BCV00_08480 [Vibrio breoganii]PMK31887.1 hypothetical protein BCU03_06025 [Vibrio breoganii]
MSKRTKSTQIILNGMLDGQHFTKRSIALITSEDSGRIMDEIRTRYLVPVECEVSRGQAAWYIKSTEIYRYKNQRAQQKSEMRKTIRGKRLIRLANQVARAIGDGDSELLRAMISKKIRQK